MLSSLLLRGDHYRSQNLQLKVLTELTYFSAGTLSADVYLLIDIVSFATETFEGVSIF